jgi:DNA processing protein
MSLTKDERIARLRLIQTDQVGPITFRQLIARFGSAVGAVEALPDLAQRGGGRAIQAAPRAPAEALLHRIGDFGAHDLHVGLAPYPSILSRTEDAPAVLVAKGHISLFDKPAVAMVGARNASAAGQRMARELAQGLSDAGWAVVSGLARGIDAAAHQGSLAGGTIAVVAGGLDVHYPPENKALQEQISQQGLLLAEQMLGVVPQARHFPRRNRIISGLARGLVVVEAAERSGSLISARFANEQGREVMAVPGSPLDPRARGCNGLIRQGATLVQSTADVLEALTPLARSMLDADRPYTPEPPTPADPTAQDRTLVQQALSPTPTPVDEIARATGAPLPVIQTILLELELAGRLERHAGNRVSARL